MPSALSTESAPPAINTSTSVSGGPNIGPDLGLAFPAVYEGRVLFEGQHVSNEFVGASVEAIIDDRVCATSTILPPREQAGTIVTPYSVLQIELGVETVGQETRLFCGRPQAVIHFLIAGSRLAVEQAVWSVGPHSLDLSWPASTPQPELSTPAAFHGRVLVSGTAAADGMVIRASIGSVACGMATTRGGRYELFLHSDTTLTGCAKPGDKISFTIAGRDAQQTSEYGRVEQATQLDLTVE